MHQNENRARVSLCRISGAVGYGGSSTIFGGHVFLKYIKFDSRVRRFDRNIGVHRRISSTMVFIIASNVHSRRDDVHGSPETCAVDNSYIGHSLIKFSIEVETRRRGHNRNGVVVDESITEKNSLLRSVFLCTHRSILSLFDRDHSVQLI